MRPFIFVSAVAALASVPLSAAAAAQERLCRFDRQVLDGVSRAVTLPVIVESKGRRGQVLVANGGQYRASIGRTTAGAITVAFKTDVSRETMTIGPGGEAFWQINFNDGKPMAYVGSCGPNRER